MILERKEKQECCRKGKKGTCATCEKNANNWAFQLLSHNSN
jgi:hypothetical protein